MAACVELRHKYRGTPAAGEGTYLMADLLLRSKRADKDASAREALGELPVVYPNSPWTPRGLLLKATLEERGKAFVVDPQLNAHGARRPHYTSHLDGPLSGRRGCRGGVR
jgi:hypothetical protein